MEFTELYIFNLIRKYDKYGVLWEPNHKFYKLNDKDAWDEIAYVLKVNREILKKNGEPNNNSLSVSPILKNITTNTELRVQARFLLHKNNKIKYAECGCERWLKLMCFSI